MIQLSSNEDGDGCGSGSSGRREVARTRENLDSRSSFAYRRTYVFFPHIEVLVHCFKSDDGDGGRMWQQPGARTHARTQAHVACLQAFSLLFLHDMFSLRCGVFMLPAEQPTNRAIRLAVQINRKHVSEASDCGIAFCALRIQTFGISSIRDSALLDAS